MALHILTPQRPLRPAWLGTVLLLTALAGGGCDATPPPAEEASVATDPDSDPAPATAPTPTAPQQRVSDEESSMTIAELRQRLGIGQAGEIRKVGGKIVAMDLRQTPVRDLSPLAGLPLQQLFVEETAVADLSPLAGLLKLSERKKQL